METEQAEKLENEQAENFLEIFFQFCKTIECCGEYDVVNLEYLKTKAQTCTPVKLPLSNPEYSFMKMRDVITINFGKNKIFSIEKFGLDALQRILEKDIDQEDTKILFMLMTHITKFTLPDPANSYTKLERTTSAANITSAMRRWTKIAKKVIEHTEIAQVLKDLMAKTFGEKYFQDMANDEEIPVKFVRSDEIFLRGFVGIDTIFINETHFTSNAFQLHLMHIGTSAEKQKLLLMDIATVVLHELAHIRVRKIDDNLNFSTPKLMVIPSTTEHEFGRMMESKIFGAVIHWKKSFERGRVSATFVDQFINSLKTNSTLPQLPPDNNLVRRESQTIGDGSGVDMCFDEDEY
ncbi:hypothetical protein HA402_005005 [Bradysia odoriphaga]|nr:hypothetical protein HA402_005005 [Bradysia odoriphaga]